MAYDWQGHTHPATQQDVALRYRRLPSDQLPRLLGAALRAGATEDGAAAGGGQQQPRGPAAAGRGATLGMFGSSDVRVSSILSAVRGDESSVRDCLPGWDAEKRLACPPPAIRRSPMTGPT